MDLQSSLSTIDTLISLAAFHTVINCHTKEEYMHEQGPKLRLPGRQCDQKFSSGDQNFVVGRQLATGKAGCHCRLSRSEKMIKN